MLLSVLLLCFVGLAAAVPHARFEFCIEDQIVESLKLKNAQDVGASNPGCSNVRDNKYTGMELDKKSITGFKKNWYGLQSRSIRSINLASNSISEITSEMLNDLPAKVKKVSLRRNMITEVKDGIIENNHLTLLDLSSNQINSIMAGALSNMQKLKTLNLQGNQLTDVEFAATLPSGLDQLFLNGNRIAQIPPGSFSTLHELKRLALRNNKITSLDGQTLLGLENLVLLELSGNPLQQIDDDTFESTPLLNMVLKDDSLHALTTVSDILSTPSVTLLLLKFDSGTNPSPNTESED